MIPGGDGGAWVGKAAGGAHGTPLLFLASATLLLACIALTAGCLSSPEPGSIAVASEPAGALVYLGGVSVGTAPLEIPNLTPGEYVIRFRREGYGDREVTVKVTAGNRTLVTARYPPLVTATPTPTTTPQVTVVPATPTLPFATALPETGSLYLTSVPSGASVTVNGVGMGMTPVLIRNLTPGTYYVRFSLVGWRDYEIALSVASGQMAMEEATLKR
ncbi:MAG: PEGA domain-containing protein [Methanomicrobiales archaeon]|nr:PEGA domain-containing protein [Methanomicrobiales archaeon]